MITVRKVEFDFLEAKYSPDATSDTVWEVHWEKKFSNRLMYWIDKLLNKEDYEETDTRHTPIPVWIKIIEIKSN
jgi:hypothetical protein